MHISTKKGDSGYTSLKLNSKAGRVGVFAGAMWDDYSSIGLDEWRDTLAEEFLGVGFLRGELIFGR